MIASIAWSGMTYEMKSTCATRPLPFGNYFAVWGSDRADTERS